MHDVQCTKDTYDRVIHKASELGQNGIKNTDRIRVCGVYTSRPGKRKMTDSGSLKRQEKKGEKRGEGSNRANQIL